MNDSQIFIAGMFVGCMLCYFAGLLKRNAPTNTHIHFTIDAEEIKLKNKSK